MRLLTPVIYVVALALIGCDSGQRSEPPPASSGGAIGIETPAPECDLDCVPNVARQMQVHRAVNNAAAFGGNNASVIFTKLERSLS